MAIHLLVVGSGSVGKRHARNFSALGCTVSCVDPRADRLDDLASEVEIVSRYTSLQSALDCGDVFNGVVVASPPSFHVDQALAANRLELPCLMEKPLATELLDANRLAIDGNLRSAFLLGYTWRWWAPLRRARKLIMAGEIGRLRHVRFVMSAHLADWHPWERYQDFFMAQRALGGGALLDESHWIDIACWFFGMPESVSGRVEKLSDLEIDSDDNVDLLLVYPEGLRVSIHLDLYGRPHEKAITFVGENGTLRWSADPNQIQLGRGIGEWYKTEEFDCERNEMFVGVAREFLQVISGAAPSCGLDDGLRVLRIVEAARRSHSESRVVQLIEEFEISA